MVLRLTVAVLLVLGTGELIARKVFNYTTEFDPMRGEVFAPGRSVAYGLEGHGLSTWWAGGIRRGQAPASQGITNVLVLGDSFTEALQVRDEEVFTQLWENALNRGGGHWQVLNAGTSGASIADYVAFAHDFRKAFQPQWTVVQVQESDFKEDAWNSKKSKGMSYFSEGVRGELELHPAVVKYHPPAGGWRAVLRVVRSHSALAQFAVERAEEFERWFQNERPLFVGPSAVTPGASAGRGAAVRDYRITEQVKQLARAYDGRVTVLFLSPFDPKEPGEMTPFEQELRTVCAAEGIRVVGLTDLYPSMVPPGGSPYGFPNRGFNRGHLNPLGHRIAAEALARASILNPTR